MEGTPLENWKMLVSEVEKLRVHYESPVSALLFRGQSDAEWALTTTLERNGCAGMLFREYYQLICANLAPEVKTFAGFNVPEYNAEVCEPFTRNRELLYAPKDVFSIDVYKYMAYLRHFGFPSPFLDWSRSLGVAAFFAFRDVRGHMPKHRSVFVYSGNPIGVGGAVGEPAIRSMGSTSKLTRGISNSAATTQFAASSTKTMDGGLIRMTLSLEMHAKSRTCCGNSIYPQASEITFCEHWKTIT